MASGYSNHGQQLEAAMYHECNLQDKQTCEPLTDLDLLDVPVVEQIDPHCAVDDASGTGPGSRIISVLEGKKGS